MLPTKDLSCKDTHRLKVKGWEKTFHANKNLQQVACSEKKKIHPALIENALLRDLQSEATCLYTGKCGRGQDRQDMLTNEST